LNIGKTTIKDSSCRFNSNLLYGIKIITALVVSLAWEAFGIPAMKIRIACPTNQGTQNILAGDHGDTVAIMIA
jgi:hypothetical protein